MAKQEGNCLEDISRGKQILNLTELSLEQLEAEFQRLRGKLKQQQPIFVDEYLIDLNATKAAERAGYSPKTAYVQGSRLLRRPTISQCIAIALEIRSRKTRTTAEWVLLNLRATFEKSDSEGNRSAANRALELIGKHLGMFGEGKEEKHLHLHKDKYVNYPEVPKSVKDWVEQMQEIGYEAGIQPVQGGAR